MRKTVVAVVLTIGTWAAPWPDVTARADNEPCSEEGACQNRSGDCRETKEGGYCSDDDLSPSFEDSPVDRSFNPVICLPGATCHVDGSGSGSGDGMGSGEGSGSGTGGRDGGGGSGSGEGT